MKRKRFSPEQVVAILREAETGKLSIPELCLKHSINEVTIYRWRKRYLGLNVNDAKRLKRLIEENARLKKLLANASGLGKPPGNAIGR